MAIRAELDDKGQKNSKTKGNGLSIEKWLAYASPESLSLCTRSRTRRSDCNPTSSRRRSTSYLTYISRFTTDGPKQWRGRIRSIVNRRAILTPLMG